MFHCMMWGSLVESDREQQRSRRLPPLQRGGSWNRKQRLADLHQYRYSAVIRSLGHLSISSSRSHELQSIACTVTAWAIAIQEPLRFAPVGQLVGIHSERCPGLFLEPNALSGVTLQHILKMREVVTNFMELSRIQNPFDKYDEPIRVEFTTMLNGPRFCSVVISDVQANDVRIEPAPNSYSDEVIFSGESRIDAAYFHLRNATTII